MPATQQNPVIWPQRFDSEAQARRAYRAAGAKEPARFVPAGKSTLIVQGAVSQAMASKLVSGLTGLRPRGENPVGPREAGRQAVATSELRPSPALATKWFSNWKSQTPGATFGDRKAFMAGITEASASAARKRVDEMLTAGGLRKNGKRKNALIETHHRGEEKKFYYTHGGKTFGPYKTYAERETARKLAMGLRQSAAEKFMAKYRFKNPGHNKPKHPKLEKDNDQGDALKTRLKELKPGAFVKVIASGERFWVHVTKVSGSTVTGAVDNDLVNTDIHGLRLQDFIEFSKDKIFALGSSNPAKNGVPAGRNAKKGGSGRLPEMTVTHGSKRADIFTEGKKFAVAIAGEARQVFDSIKAAVSYARLRLHEVANQPAKLTANSKAVAKLLKKANPGGRRGNPENSAVEMYEMFHGLPSTQFVEYREKFHVHEFMWAAGTLVSMVVTGPRGGQITLSSPDPDKVDFSQVVMVCFSEDGKQIYFRGGEQDLPLDGIVEAFALNDDDVRDNMEVGRIKRLTYRTFKNFEENGQVPIDFYHNHGKEDAEGVLPLLCYKPLDPSMFVVGGRYKIAPKDRVLKASPGVVG